MSDYKTQLDYICEHETSTPDRVWMTQPIGGGAVQELTFKQGMDQARRMAAHLKSLGLPPKSQIAIFSKNTAHWILADVAIWMAGHVSVPLYPILTPTTIGQILEHSESRLIFVGKLDGYDEMAPGIPQGMARIALPLAPAGCADETWDAVIGRTQPLSDFPRREADDLATLIYTSGSTGMPKGVMHSFRTMTDSALGIGAALHVDASDRMLSYLPLAHAFERWIVETGTLVGGFQVYFAETLNSFAADLRRASPTLFISVPRLWSKFQVGVLAKMPRKRLDLLLKIPLVRRIIRKKVLTALGLQNVRFAGSGSAPIPAELIDWYRALGLELLEGYGMSENFCYSHVTKPGQVRVGYVGSTYPGVHCKISEAGEILVKSPGTMLGYYKEPEKTAETMTADGYLMTGDRGEIDELGRLKITGRVKELFKTAKGKYVAPAPIENKLMLHDDVEMACVSGDGQPQPFAMLVLSEEAQKKIGDAAFKGELTESLKSFLGEVNGQLDHHEQLALLTVMTEPWTVENGFLTPTMKLKRNAIEQAVGPKVDGWYAKKQPVLWV